MIVFCEKIVLFQEGGRWRVFPFHHLACFDWGVRSEEQVPIISMEISDLRDLAEPTVFLSKVARELITPRPHQKRWRDNHTEYSSGYSLNKLYFIKITLKCFNTGLPKMALFSPNYGILVLH